MKLKLTRPLVFFDLETTGVNVATDRIVEISLVKQFPDGNKESKTWRVNPGIPIPKEASDVHHILDEDVADMPSFKELAPQVLAFIEDCDLAGYNSNHFDVPILQEELLRAGLDVDLKKNHHFVDAFVIFQKHTPRNLTAAYKHYCNKDLEGAHGANADTEATREVLLAQLERHADVPQTVAELEEYTMQQKCADLAGRIGYDTQGQEIFTFGKHRGRPLTEVFSREPSYYTWIQEGDFPLYTKRICKEAMDKIKMENRLKKLQNKFPAKQNHTKKDSSDWTAKPGELQF
ncbi:MAG: 3'-5' exonuclease [Paludibacteraceae bacterium]|nr:3'-5' exonuclease [Paludibacteraceae bacterium]